VWLAAATLLAEMLCCIEVFGIVKTDLQLDTYHKL
jgi:hypothetical protein